jgi:hypothetical protein
LLLATQLGDRFSDTVASIVFRCKLGAELSWWDFQVILSHGNTEVLHERIAEFAYPLEIGPPS